MLVLVQARQQVLGGAGGWASTGFPGVIFTFGPVRSLVGRERREIVGLEAAAVVEPPPAGGPGRTRFTKVRRALPARKICLYRSSTPGLRTRALLARSTAIAAASSAVAPSGR